MMLAGMRHTKCKSWGDRDAGAEHLCAGGVVSHRQFGLSQPKKNPNVAADSSLNFYAIRNIEEGEELTVDYGTYSENESDISSESLGEK